MSQQNKNSSLWQQIAQLPPALQSRVSKNLIVAFVIVLLTVFIMFFFKDMNYVIGLLIALYIAWLGLDVMWQYQDGKIIKKHVRCVTMVPVKSFQRLHKMQEVILQDLDAPDDSERAILSYYIQAGKDNKDAAKFFEGAKLYIYVSTGTAGDLIAWDLLGSDMQQGS